MRVNDGLVLHTVRLCVEQRDKLGAYRATDVLRLEPHSSREYLPRTQILESHGLNCPLSAYGCMQVSK